MVLLTYFLEYHQPRRINHLLGLESELRDGKLKPKKGKDGKYIVKIDWDTVDHKIFETPGYLPNGETFLWDKMNEEVFRKVANKCYKPANKMLTDMVNENPNFKIAISTTGVMLEQALKWDQEVIDVIRALLRAGRKNNQVEMLAETYYHSVSSLFHDPELKEFEEQVKMHGKLIYELFGVTPRAFRNTEHMTNNRILDKIQSMGFDIALCEYRPDMDINQHLEDKDPNRVSRTYNMFKSKNGLEVIPRHRKLSDGPGYRFGTDNEYVRADYFAKQISNIAGEIVGIFIDGEHMGEHKWSDTGIFEFYRHLPRELANHSNIIMATPSDVADRFAYANCPVIDINEWSTSTWADKDQDTKGWLSGKEQYGMFVRMESMERDVKQVGGELLNLWRYLTTSCNLHNCYKSDTPDGGVHSYFSAYEDPDHAIAVFNSALNYFSAVIKHHKK